MDPFDIPAGSVAILSGCAVSAARKYVELVEAQVSQAHTDMHSAALAEYRSIAYPDEADYDCCVGAVDRSFEEDYRPILRFTEVIYLYMVFETYTGRHVAEVQQFRHDRADILKQLKKKHQCGLAEAAQIYFRDYVGWSILDIEDWAALRDIAELRNCIAHNAGVARDTKYPKRIDNLEVRKWRGHSIGIEIDRYQGKDVGLPVIVHQRFLEYFVELLDRFFNAVGEATHVHFWSKKGT